MTTGLLAFGRRGASAPLLLLYAPQLTPSQLTAPAYSTLYPVTRRSEPLREFRKGADGAWGAVRGGLRVSLPRQAQGHRLHTPIALPIKSKKRSIL